MENPTFLVPHQQGGEKKRFSTFPRTATVFPPFCLLQGKILGEKWKSTMDKNVGSMTQLWAKVSHLLQISLQLWHTLVFTSRKFSGYQCPKSLKIFLGACCFHHPVLAHPKHFRHQTQFRFTKTFFPPDTRNYSPFKHEVVFNPPPLCFKKVIITLKNYNSRV